MDGKNKIIIGILLIIIVILISVIAMTFVFPSNIQTDVLETKDCQLNASHFSKPVNENGVFGILGTASSTEITFIEVDEDAVDGMVTSWWDGDFNGTAYNIAGLNGLLVQDLSGNALSFFFEKNGKYYKLDAVAESGSENGNIQLTSFRGLSILSEFNEILNVWQKGLPDESNENITSNAVEATPTSTATSSQSSTASYDADSSSSGEREEDKITQDGWNPKEHEVSRESLDDGNERVNYDDGYFRVVDKDGNILSYGY